MAAAPAAAPAPEPPLAPSEAAEWHGYLCAGLGLPRPTCVTASDTLSRPKYTDIKSAEYADGPAALDAKADMLIRMWTEAERPLVYAGAGISTSSGIRDYASNAKGSKVQATNGRLTMSRIEALEPTPAHRVIAAMEQQGHVWGWLQQNHDGLAQKAGFPSRKVNELHGSWLDNKKNPIIAMSGSLRGDLFEWLMQMDARCDFVLAVGSSLSGLNADRVVESCNRRHQEKGKGQGVCILTIQKTRLDKCAAVRVFSPIDAFMLIVAKKLRLALGTRTHAYSPAALPVGPPAEPLWERERDSRRAAAEEKQWRTPRRGSSLAAAAPEAQQSGATPKLPPVAGAAPRGRAGSAVKPPVPPARQRTKSVVGRNGNVAKPRV